MNTSNSTDTKTPGKTPGGIDERIMEFARQMGEGKPFWTSELSHLEKRTTVSHALSRLVRVEKLMRVMRGLYVLKRVSRLFGLLPPYAKEVLMAISRVTGEIFEVSPEDALSALRLTTQNQLVKTLSTTGRPRTLRMNGIQPIRLKSAPRKKAIAPIMGSMAGAAAIALLYLGPKDVDEDVMKTIKKNMEPEDFERLVSVAPQMPLWLADILLHNKFRASIRNRKPEFRENSL